MRFITTLLLTSAPILLFGQERLSKLNLSVLRRPSDKAALVLTASSNDPLGFATSLQNSFNIIGLYLPVASVDGNVDESVLQKYRGSEMLSINYSYNYRADTGCGGAVPNRMSGQIFLHMSDGNSISCGNFTFSQGGFEGKCMSRITDDLARRLKSQYGLSSQIQLNGVTGALGSVLNTKIDEDSLRSVIEYSDQNAAEGIYKSMIGEDEKCGTYRIGIMADGYGFNAINLQQKDDWHVGEVKAEFEETAVDGIYSGIWNNSRKQPVDCMFNLEGGLLEIYSEELSCSFVKLWPKSNAQSRPAAVTGLDLNVIATGSAVVLDSRLGLCITNAHVVENQPEVFVKVKSEEYKCDVIQIDVNNDLALLRMKEHDPSEIKGLPLSMSPKVGAKVYSAGYPKMDIMGESLKVTEGIISSLSFLNDPSKFQISCPITNGNSGGALLDENGNLIGITQGGYRPDIATENVNAAVKALFILNLGQMVPDANLNLSSNSHAVDFDEMTRSVLPVLIKE